MAACHSLSPYCRQRNIVHLTSMTGNIIAAMIYEVTYEATTVIARNSSVSVVSTTPIPSTNFSTTSQSSTQNPFACFKGTNYISGKPGGEKEQCTRDRSCFIITGKLPGYKHTRGCANDYIVNVCKKYNVYNSTAGCVNLDTDEIKGRLCCCSDHSNCNTASKSDIPVLLASFVVFSFIVRLIHQQTS
ncbi:hypothetical protein Ddc_05890 [Ditylenchus destructor]|nr:hypothetical protein Ddc_05890 [Ditylenchus destructor]